MLKEYLPANDVNKLVEQQWEERWENSLVIDGNRVVMKSEELSLIHPFLSTLHLRSRVLDAGCGLGYWTLFLNGLGYDVIGIDIGRKTIYQLQKRFPHIHFSCQDIRSLPYEDLTFDAYISWGVFEHFEDGPGECLKEAWRILKPGGMLFISVPFCNIRLSVMQKLFGIKEIVPRGINKLVFYQYRFKKDELKRELVQSGFIIRKIHPIHGYHGLLRFLNASFNLDIERIGEIIINKTRNKFLKRAWLAPFYILSRLLPSNLFSHMLIAIAQKES